MTRRPHRGAPRTRAGRPSPLLRHPVAVGFALMVVFGLLSILWSGSTEVLLGFLGVLGAMLLSYPIDFFSRFMPRALALVLTLAILVAGLAGLVALVVPVVAAEATRLSQRLPVALERLQTWLSHLQSASLPGLPRGGDLTPRLVAELSGLLGRAVPLALGAGSVLILVFVLFVLAFFLAYAPDTYREGLRALVPRAYEPVFDELWVRLGLTLRRWTAGILGSMLAMGVLAGLGLFLAGIDGWFLLGILTFLGTFVPYVGALASAIPGLLVGLAQSPLHLLYAAIVYACVHLAEGYVVSPLIMRRAVHIHPALLVFWQLFMAAIFGLPGIVVATPLLACIKIAAGYLYIERRLGKPGPRP